MMLLKFLFHNFLYLSYFCFIFEMRVQVKVKKQNERDAQQNSRDFKPKPDNSSKVGEKSDPTTLKTSEEFLIKMAE